MIKYLELALSQEVYEYFEELDEMNWSARGNVLNQYLRNTSIGTTVNYKNKFHIKDKVRSIPKYKICSKNLRRSGEMCISTYMEALFPIIFAYRTVNTN